MKKYITILFGVITAAIVNSCAAGSDDPVVTPPSPQLITTAASGITANAATTGGNIVGIATLPISARGVVWDINPNPTTALSTKTVNGEGDGDFTATLTGLSSNTEYHIRAYAISGEATFYGNDITFTTLTQHLVLGQYYQGGYIVYLYKSGDAGYSATVQHGLIANNDVIDNNYYDWGCINALQTNTSTIFGSGTANTQWLAAHCLESNTAITFCNNYTVAGYSDWFLPSKDELIKLSALNNALDDYYFNQNIYLSSSEVSATKVWGVDFQDGSEGNASQVFKNSAEYNVCPIRKF
jgi:hypothetical protein